MNNIIIEKVSKENLKACATISVKSWQETYKNIVDQEYLNNLNIETRYQKFLTNYQSSPFLIAKINNQVVGFCRYTTNITYPQFPEIDSELTVLYEDPKLKRNGVGSTLFNYVKKELKSQNKKYMLITCLKNNKIGKNFYQKMQGTIISENNIEIGDKIYPELAFRFIL